MTIASASSAIRNFSADALTLAKNSPGTFARAHGIEAGEAVPIITKELALRKSHKIWRR